MASAPEYSAHASAPHTVFDANFDMKVDLYSGHAEFGIPVKAARSAAAGEQTLTVHVASLKQYRQVPFPPVDRLRETVAPKLFELSRCKDYYEDHGHERGVDLSDEDKRALIELLKTF